MVMKSIFRLSYKAFVFLHNTRDILRTEPYMYSVPTILNKYNFNVFIKNTN